MLRLSVYCPYPSMPFLFLFWTSCHLSNRPNTGCRFYFSLLLFGSRSTQYEYIGQWIICFVQFISTFHQIWMRFSVLCLRWFEPTRYEQTGGRLNVSHRRVKCKVAKRKSFVRDNIVRSLWIVYISFRVVFSWCNICDCLRLLCACVVIVLVIRLSFGILAAIFARTTKHNTAHWNIQTHRC